MAFHAEGRDIRILMSDQPYLVSARKYRPQAWDAVVGQSGITQTLQQSIASGQIAQAYLFCGPRGVGKTTSARIFARAINGFDVQDEAMSFNVFELDAASNNKVEDIRSIVDQVRIPPQQGKYKVYIIDEVHMLSQAAFNAFLKTLEEPPAHAVFILATTEKHKILPTILSRCQIFDFHRITVPDAVAHLQHIAAQEGVSAEEEALHVIAQKADGALRDALSMFDQLVAFAGKNLTYQAVTEQLHVLDHDTYFTLTDQALASDIPGAMLLFNDVMARGFDAHHFITGWANHLRNLMVCRDPQTLKLVEATDDVKAKFQGLWVTAHHEVAQVVGPARDEVVSVKPARHDVVEQQHGSRNVTCEGLVGQCEIRVVVEHMQLFRDRLVREVLAGERHKLIKHGQRVAKRAVRFLGNDVERFFFSVYPLLCCNVLKMRHSVGHRDAVKVEDLAARQNRRQNLVLLRGGQNEHRMRRRLLQRLQKRVERCLAEHVHLVDDVHLVFALLGRDANLIDDASNVLDLVVGGGVQLKHIERHGFVLHVETVDGPSENSRRCRLSDPTWTAEQIGLSNLPRRDALLQRLGDARLPHHRIPSLGAVLSGTDEVGLFAHETANIDLPRAEGQTRLFTTHPHLWPWRCWFSEEFDVLLRPIN